MAKDKKRAMAVFNISKLRRLGDFREKVELILADIGGNTTLFPTPSPTVAIVNGHISNLADAQVLVGQRVPGSVAVRNEAYSVVVTDIRNWQRYVQGLADVATFEQAVILITSAGFDLRVNGVYIKPDLRIMLTVNPNVIRLIAKSAGKGAAYEWQQSINNGVLWTNLPVTNVANLQVGGLTSKATYLFRFRSTVKGVTSGWSLPVNIVVQ